MPIRFVSYIPSAIYPNPENVISPVTTLASLRWLMAMLNDHPEINASGEILMYSPTSVDSLSIIDEFLAPKENDDIVHHAFKYFEGQGGLNFCPGEIETAEDMKFLKRLLAAKAKIVVFEREGLALLVSKIKHQETQAYRCGDAACVVESQAHQVFIDPGTVLTRLNNFMKSWNEELACVRASVPFDRILYLNYGDLSRDTPGEMRRLFAFLGVSVDRQVNVKVTLKMGHANIYDSISNANEIRNVLNGTIWEV
jgi:hypothetical protein